LHANFIVAHDDATADDVLHLIRLARARVAEATGIELEPEVDIW
jgi:UDP-N-acetylmuramate dehydrogenase